MKIANIKNLSLDRSYNVSGLKKSFVSFKSNSIKDNQNLSRDIFNCNDFEIITPYAKNASDIQKAFEEFFSNDKEVENIIKNADIKKYNSGLPLKYPREQYLSDLEKILNGLNDAKKEEIFAKLNIEPYFEEGKLRGYDGILSLDNLSLKDKTEKRIYNISKRFINNSIQTDDKKLNNSLNSFLNAYLEFVNIIGKKQNQGHYYTLDVHILQVLQDCMKEAEYDSLNDEEKLVLKLSIMFHDIAKKEKAVDKKHPLNSSLYAKDILKKVKLPNEIKNKVILLIKNHSWLELYSNGILSAKETAELFETKENFKLAKILTKADIQGNIYHQYISSCMQEENINPIEKYL